MKPFRFWLLFACVSLYGIVGFCLIDPADAQASPPPRPVVKLGAPSRVLVKIGTAYRAEYHRPARHRRGHKRGHKR